jgi:hypothetical protein
MVYEACFIALLFAMVIVFPLSVIGAGIYGIFRGVNSFRQDRMLHSFLWFTIGAWFVLTGFFWFLLPTLI